MSKAPLSNAPMANAPAPPGYYNSLDGSLVQAWALLTRGVADRRAPFHTPTIATVDAQGSPHVRTIVLRACDPASRLLRFHTDVRGEKVVHIAGNPRVAMHFYDVGAKLQLRVSGCAEVLSSGPVTDEAWLRSQPQSRECYAAVKAPGAVIATPEPVSVANALKPAEAQKNFCAVLVSAARIEWLYLAAEGHRRAVWSWEDESWHGAWLQP